MLAELFHAVSDQAVSATRTETVEFDDIPRVKFVFKPDGTRDEILAPPPPRLPAFSSYGSLVSYLNREAEVGGQPEVYVGKSRVTAYLDRMERLEYAEMPLILTERFQNLQNLDFSDSPRAIIRWLLRDYDPVAQSGTTGIIEALSRVDFKLLQTGKSEIAHGRETLGKSVEAAVQQAEEIPERFTLNVKVWRHLDYTATVQIGVYLDLQEQKVHLFTNKDEVDEVFHYAVRNLAADLESGLKGIPVYIGMP